MDSVLTRIAKIVDNIIVSKYHIGQIENLICFIQTENPYLTNVKDGIIYLLKEDLKGLVGIINLINEYGLNFISHFPEEYITDFTGNPKKCLILILAYLSNYQNIFNHCTTSVINDIDEFLYNNLNEMRLKFASVQMPLKKHAQIFREWFIKKYYQAGFILWEDPVIWNNNKLVI